MSYAAVLSKSSTRIDYDTQKHFKFIPRDYREYLTINKTICLNTTLILTSIALKIIYVVKCPKPEIIYKMFHLKIFSKNKYLT